MSKKYNEYISRHIKAVNECYQLLTGIRHFEAGINHDYSKYSMEEYGAYDEYFYPSDGSEVGADPKRKKAFDYAWLHHQNSNPHHWQHWVLINDENGIEPLEMPARYVEEMVADWGAFAYLKKDGNALIRWYESHKDKMILHKDTRKLVEELVPDLAFSINRRFQQEKEESNG